MSNKNGSGKQELIGKWNFATYGIKGVMPIMIASDVAADPDNEYAQQMKEITVKRGKKTKSDREELNYLKWISALYWDDKVGVYLPGVMIDAAIENAARAESKGKDVTRGIMTKDEKIKLNFEDDNIDSKDKLYATGKYIDIRMAVIDKNRVPVCRPIFPEWSAKFTLAYNTGIFDIERITYYLSIARIGTFRKRYGSFIPELIGISDKLI